MSIVTIDDSNLTAIGNAIRTKNGATTTYKPSEMAAAISAIETGEDFLPQKITNTLTSYSNNDITAIGAYGLYGCSSLASVSLPNVTTIGHHGFCRCTGLTSLTSLNLPNLTTIEQYGFAECKGLTSVSLPSVTTIRERAFSGYPMSLKRLSCRNALLGVWVFSILGEYGSGSLRQYALEELDIRGFLNEGETAEDGIRESHLNDIAIDRLILRKNDGIVEIKTSPWSSVSDIMSNANFTLYVPDNLVSAYREDANWIEYCTNVRNSDVYTLIKRISDLGRAYL